MHPRGLFENILTEALAARLHELDATVRADSGPLHAADAGDRLALLLGQVVRRAVDELPDDVRVSKGVALARTLIDVIAVVEKELSTERPVVEGRVLNAISPIRPDGTVATITAPLIPLLDTTLLTNAPRDPASVSKSSQKSLQRTAST